MNEKYRVERKPYKGKKKNKWKLEKSFSSWDDAKTYCELKAKLEPVFNWRINNGPT